MKVTLSITAILFITLTGLYQQPKLHYVENSLLKAKKESIRQNKPLFIKAYASWCGACRKLNNTPLADKEVITTLNKHYICYQIDMETEEGRSFAKKYNIRGYPTLLIFGPDRNNFV